MAKSRIVTEKPTQTVLIDFDVAADGAVTRVSSSLPPRAMNTWPRNFRSVAEGEARISDLLSSQRGAPQQIIVCLTTYPARQPH